MFFQVSFSCPKSVCIVLYPQTSEYSNRLQRVDSRNGEVQVSYSAHCDVQVSATCVIDSVTRANPPHHAHGVRVACARNGPEPGFGLDG